MWRKRLLRSLDELVSIDFLLDPIQGSRARATLFYLSYQGLNDRLVHETCAFLCSGSGQDYVKPRKGRRDSKSKLKVGFISPHFYLHTIGKVYGGIISQLQGERIEVTVLSLSNR